MIDSEGKKKSIIHSFYIYFRMFYQNILEHSKFILECSKINIIECSLIKKYHKIKIVIKKFFNGRRSYIKKRKRGNRIKDKEQRNGSYIT